MICALCTGAINQGDAVNLHHPLPKSRGGVETVPTHEECHVEHHSVQGDFAEWGRQGGIITAATKRWALNLKNVRQHPAYELARAYHRALYAH